MKFLNIIHVPLLARHVHLVDEKLDVVYWTDHVMRDSRVQHLHHMVLMTLFL
jgi:hypothetical protein